MMRKPGIQFELDICRTKRINCGVCMCVTESKRTVGMREIPRKPRENKEQ